MDLQALFHWIYVIAMVIGALYFVALINNPRGGAKYLSPKKPYLLWAEEQAQNLKLDPFL